MQDELVTIMKYLMPMEAHILKSQLEAAGIPAAVFHENFSTIYPFAAQLTGGVELKVRAQDLERAQEILADGPHLSEEE
jgi:hypothetical protein